MESADLSKTLEVLKAVSDLELAIANLYRYFSEIREPERDFWLALEKDEHEKAIWARPEDCNACGVCELRCPDMAIEVKKS